MSTRPCRRWRVTVTEWLSHVAVIEADTADDAEELALELWPTNDEHESFRYYDSAQDAVFVEED